MWRLNASTRGYSFLQCTAAVPLLSRRKRDGEAILGGAVADLVSEECTPCVVLPPAVESAGRVERQCGVGVGPVLEDAGDRLSVGMAECRAVGREHPQRA